MKKELKVILTSAGSQVAPSLISLLKKNRSYKIFVIGVDSGIKDRLAGRFFCDKFYAVPAGKNKNYVQEIYKICKKENVSLVFPASDEEALALSREKEKFVKIGSNIISSDFKTVKMTLDKFKLITFLKEKGLFRGKIFGINDFNDIRKSAMALGYPRNDFVIKPRIARGSRGFRVITNRLKPFERYYGNKFFYSDLNEIESLFKNNKNKINNFFIMEYFKEPTYSVDLLMEKSKPVLGICRKKIFPINSPTQTAEIVFDKDIIEYASKVASLLGFDFFVQLEIGRDKKRKPSLIEINPRLDATLPIVEGAGVNYFEEIIYYAEKGKFNRRFKIVNKPIRFYRYWSHIFEKLDG